MDFIATIISLIVIKQLCDASRILVVLPHGAKSHFLFFEPFMHEMAHRGHEVVVVTPFPRKAPVNGNIYIDISAYAYKVLGEYEAEVYDESVLSSMIGFYRTLNNKTRLFISPDVNRLFETSQKKFDVVITELFETDAMLMFAHKLGIPSIAISPCVSMPWTYARFANPDNPSYIPNVFSSYTNRMTFVQRIFNTAMWATTNLVYDIFFVHRSQQLLEKHFGNETPSLKELAKNTSLMFVNTHHSLHGSHPNAMNVIEVGGINIKPLQKLPKDLEKFINESQHGVIYFCMGSMLKASTLPVDKRDALINVFSRLPQRVLWKWENDTMPGKPDNVKLVKWMPQRDVLAHPNVRLFISHGGLLGTTEAVYSGVPILGMPFYGDQGVNIAAVVANGAGLRLDFKDLNKDTLYSALTELLNNPKYKESANDLSERFRDRPQTPLETAVYWTEYVIRHKGAPHLRSAAVDLTWYQYLLLDVIAFMILVAVAALIVTYYTLKFLINLVKRTISKPQDTKSKKQKTK